MTSQKASRSIFSTALVGQTNALVTLVKRTVGRTPPVLAMTSCPIGYKESVCGQIVVQTTTRTVTRRPVRPRCSVRQYHRAQGHVHVGMLEQQLPSLART